MIGLNPFAAPVAVGAAKIFAGVAAAALLGLTVQTVRIEGAFCREVKAGEKPACIVRGFKQQIASIRIDLEAVRRDRDREHDNHEQTKRNYASGQVEAQRLEAERLARVQAQQERNNADGSRHYAQRLAELRARYERVRGAQGEAGLGAAGSAGEGIAVPGLPTAASGAAQAATGEGFPLDLRLVASAQAEQLDALITVIERQAAIDPNSAPR